MQCIHIFMFLYHACAARCSIAADRCGFQTICDCRPLGILYRKTKVKSHLRILVFQNKIDRQSRRIFRHARWGERNGVAAVLVLHRGSLCHFFVFGVRIRDRHLCRCQLVGALRLESQCDWKIIACSDIVEESIFIIIDNAQRIFIFMPLHRAC